MFNCCNKTSFCHDVLFLQTALAVQSLNLTGISKQHYGHHAFESVLDRNSKNRQGIEHQSNLLPSSSSWGGSELQALGLLKRDIVDSSMKENLKVKIIEWTIQRNTPQQQKHYP